MMKCLQHEDSQDHSSMKTFVSLVCFSGSSLNVGFVRIVKSSVFVI